MHAQTNVHGGMTERLYPPMAMPKSGLEEPTLLLTQMAMPMSILLFGSLRGIHDQERTRSSTIEMALRPTTELRTSICSLDRRTRKNMDAWNSAMKRFGTCAFSMLLESIHSKSWLVDTGLLLNVSPR